MSFAAALRAAERIRSTRRAAGVSALYAPGEPEWRRRDRSAGEVHLAPRPPKCWRGWRTIWGSAGMQCMLIPTRRRTDMPKREVSSDAIRKPVGVFSSDGS